MGFKLGHDLPVNLNVLHRRLGEWSDATFGADRGPVPPLQHLRREVVEAIENPHDAEEYADCMLLLFDASRRAGISLDDLLMATAAKLVANEGGQPDDEGVVEHVR